jgi:FHS family L-fucose permease-like MFS transporter
MKIDTADTSSTDPVPGDAEPAISVDAPDLRLFVFALFFVFGGITSLNDVIIPKLKDLFTLSYAQAMLVQSAFFAAYFLVSVPAAGIVRRAGYLRTAALGVLTMAVGCLLFIPASRSGQFAVFLCALFVLAAGITIVQVVANPLISLLGAPRTAHSRLTFAQAFNSLGTTVFPYFGSILILGALASVAPDASDLAALSAYRTQETQVVVNTYLGLAAALGLLAIVIWLRRHRLRESHGEPTRLIRSLDLLKKLRFGWGSACIFLYVGAEVAIGSLLVNYLMQASTLGLAEQAAGKHVPYYWGGALVGRFIGAWLLRIVSPGKVLATAAAGSILLIAASMSTQGVVSGWTLLAVGLCNSIMFPTIFSLASEGLGRRAAEGSGLICVAIVGGAIIPPLTGHLADVTNLRTALCLPAACYAVIAAYGIYARRPLVT